MPFGGVALPLAVAICLGSQPSVAETENLEVGQSYQRRLAADDAHTYSFLIEDALPRLVRVMQGGLDLVLAITSPDGTRTQYNSPTYRDDDEYIYVAANSGGAYELAITSEELTESVAAYQISISRLPSDRAAEGWRLMSSAGMANAAGDWRRSFEGYLAAAEIWEELDNASLNAQALYSASMLDYWWFGEWNRAASFAATAAERYLYADRPSLSANARKLEGLALIELANEVDQSSSGYVISPERRRYFDQALALFDMAIAAHAEIGNEYDVAEISNFVGLTHYYMGDFPAARAFYERAAESYRSLGEIASQIQVQNNLAVLDIDDGRYLAASSALERSLEIIPVGRSEQLRADLLDNLGNTYRLAGATDNSLSAFSEALKTHQLIDDRTGQGRSLYGLGQTYFSIGELELAADYLQRALPILRESNDGRTEHAVLRYLGDIASLESNHENALRYHQAALDLATTAREKVTIEGAISRDLINLGRFPAALATARETLSAAEDTGSELLSTRARVSYGVSLLAAGDVEEARAVLRAALTAARLLALNEDLAEILHQLSRTAKASGHLAQAAELGEQAIKHFEGLRSQLIDPELRAFFMARRLDYFDEQIAVLMDLYAATGDPTYLEQSFHVSERSRARMMVELLSEASVDLYGEIDADIASKQEELLHKLDSLHRRKSSTADAEDLARLVGEMSSIEHELHLIDTEIRRRAPNVAGMDNLEVLTVDEVQALLDDETMLLQYAINGAGSYVWVVTSDAVDAFELAAEADVERAAKQAFAAVSTSGPRIAAGDNLQTLSRLVVQPIEHLLDKRKILVVTEGALQYVPFGLLRASETSDAALLEEHDIISIPSITAASALRRETDAPRMLAMFADPVFDQRDSRVFGGRSAEITAGGSPAQSMDPDLGRLPFAGQEADWIAELMPPEDRLVAKGFDASREAVLAAPLDQFKYVHFATHGLIDTRYPALSSLVLSGIDSGLKAINSHLRLDDIYRLRLNADLVVLSACDTALGRDVRGEGLIGLTQGFLYAGAESLVVSLWQVPDQATATLMREFYEGIIKRGWSPPEALRRAQMAIAAKGRWRHPYYWGAFIYVGGWS